MSASRQTGVLESGFGVSVVVQRIRAAWPGAVHWLECLKTTDWEDRIQIFSEINVML